MPRLFAALPLPDVARQELAAYQQARSPFIRFTTPEQLHLTLCFLGDVAEERVEAICGRLSRLANTFAPFELKLNRFRFKQPAMIWAVTERSEPFNALYRAAHEEMAKVAPELVWIAEEMREPHPHITLARLARGAGRVSVPTMTKPIVFTADQIQLMQSTLQPSGPIYELIETFPLTKTV